MSEALTGLEGKLSDDLTALCDALVEVRKLTRSLSTILDRILDKRERRVARKMVSAEALELMRVAAGG